MKKFLTQLSKGVLSKDVLKSEKELVGYLLKQKILKGKKELKLKVDYAEYGGAPLLGVNGCAIISHGKSNSKAIKNAIFQAIAYNDSGVNSAIEKLLTKNKV